MKLLLRSILLWASLAGLSGVIISGTRPDGYQLLIILAVLVLPSLCVWLTFSAVPPLHCSSIWRVGLWAVTIVCWSCTAIFAQGRWESSELFDEDRETLIVGFGLMIFSAGWIAVKQRALPAWSTLRDVALSAAILVCAGGVYLWSYDARTQAIAVQTEARWSEIGRPMPDFEKNPRCES